MAIRNIREMGRRYSQKEMPGGKRGYAEDRRADTGYV